MTGLEPAASWSQTKHSTKLRYIPLCALPVEVIGGAYKQKHLKLLEFIYYSTGVVILCEELRYSHISRLLSDIWHRRFGFLLQFSPTLVSLTHRAKHFIPIGRESRI